MADQSINYAQQMSDEGKIDDVSNLESTPVVIFSSGDDSIMPKAMQDAQKEFYEHFGSNVDYYYNEDYQHGWPVDISPDELPSEPCTKFNYPVQNCGEYGTDGPGTILQHTLPNVPGSTITSLEPKNYDWRGLGVTKVFNQKEFVDAGMFIDSGLDDFGIVFIPNQCLEDETIKCKIHVHTHGCSNQYYIAGINQINHSGWNEWAVTNDIIVVHP